MTIPEESLHLAELHEEENTNQVINETQETIEYETEKPKKLILTEEDEIDEIFGEDFDFGNENDYKENDEDKLNREKNAKFAGIVINTVFYFIIIVGICGFLYGFFTHSIYNSEKGKAFLNNFDFGTYEGNIINDCNATSYFLNKVDNYYSYIPKSMTKEFEERGYVICVVDDITETTGITASYTSPQFSEYEVSGLYSGAKDTIYIRYMWSDAKCVMHELGHFVSMEFHLLDTDDGSYYEFESIYQKDKENFKKHMNNGVYATCNITEYFAESFQQYFENPSTLLKYCPSTYEYFEKLEADFDSGLYDNYVYDNGYDEHN